MVPDGEEPSSELGRSVPGRPSKHSATSVGVFFWGRFTVGRNRSFTF